ncbi:MAG: molybdopterin-dependent oxidoreductase [Deltaproteobacteria bacterium]|nr:molybdopterin-dependent oxidoreductase [Deltaproteobacteria bacterium]
MLYRRQFLLNVCKGAVLAGMPAWGCTPARPRPAVLQHAKQGWANTICQLCPSGCGLRVRLVGGSPVTVTGNPLHPVNRGGVCARGVASLQLYYDPDRLEEPLRRDQNSALGWSPVSWDEGLDELVGRLESSLVAGNGRVAVLRGGGQDVSSQLLGRLVRSMGSDWIVDMVSRGERAADEAVRRMHGTSGKLVYEMAGADFLFSFDSGLLESPSRMMTLHRAFADMRAAGGTFVHAGPRMGVTGAKADLWLPARPGTAGVLALGIAHMLIKEGYEKSEFLRDHVSGFDDWVDEAEIPHLGVRSWILREFVPERVAERTGLEWGEIIRVARHFGSAHHPLAIGPMEAGAAVTPFDLMAVHTLNAIVGAIDAPGGVLLAQQPPFEPLDAASSRDAGPRGPEERSSPSVEEFADWVLGAETVPIDVVFVHDADPVFTSESGRRVEEALRRIPLVVSTSPVITDTVQSAHLVLPESLWLERRCDSTTVDRDAYPVMSLSAAATGRKGDTRNVGDVVLKIAAKLGGAIAARFPWASYDDVVRERVEMLFRAGVGDTFSESHRSAWTQMLERSGWRTPSYETAEALERNMERDGGWWDPVYHHGEWRRVVRGGASRVNLEPLRLAFRPRAFETPEGPEEGALFLYVYPEPLLTTRTGGSLPYLQDLGSPFCQKGWVTSAELNPVTARRLRLAHGDHVRVSSERGELEAVVVSSAGIRPDVVAVYIGGGRVAGGRYAAGIGANPLRLLAEQDAGDAGRSPSLPTSVRVTVIA